MRLFYIERRVIREVNLESSADAIAMADDPAIYDVYLVRRSRTVSRVSRPVSDANYNRDDGREADPSLQY